MSLVLALRSAVLDVLDEAGIRVPVSRRGMLRNALASKITGVLEARGVPVFPVGNPSGSPAVPAEYEVTEAGLTPYSRGDDAQMLARVDREPSRALVAAGAVTPWGTSTPTGTRREDADPAISPEQRAAFEKGELVLLPVTVNRPGHLGATEQALVPVAPRDLRAGIESARRSVQETRGRIAARLGDMPPAPERCMLRAHLDSGYLDAWIEDVERWRRSMLEEFVAPTGRRA